MTGKKRPDLSGTARCGDCGATAEYPQVGVPGSGALTIRHAKTCSLAGFTAEEITEAGEILADLKYPPAVDIRVDGTHGHIVVTTGEDPREAVFADLGPVLHLWSGQGAELGPPTARALGKALIGWADRKDPPPFDLMVTLTGEALRYLRFAVSDDEQDQAPLHTVRLAVDQGTFKVKENEDTWSPPLTDGVLIQEGHDIP